jgi:hypothetical protein
MTFYYGRLKLFNSTDNSCLRVKQFQKVVVQILVIQTIAIQTIDPLPAFLHINQV